MPRGKHKASRAPSARSLFVPDRAHSAAAAPRSELTAQQCHPVSMSCSSSNPGKDTVSVSFPVAVIKMFRQKPLKQTVVYSGLQLPGDTVLPGGVGLGMMAGTEEAGWSCYICVLETESD